MFGIGLTELIVVFVLALLIFGPRKLPEVGRTVGKWASDLRHAFQDISDELQDTLKVEMPDEEMGSLEKHLPKEKTGEPGRRDQAGKQPDADP